MDNIQGRTRLNQEVPDLPDPHTNSKEMSAPWIHGVQGQEHQAGCLSGTLRQLQRERIPLYEIGKYWDVWRNVPK